MEFLRENTMVNRQLSRFFSSARKTIMWLSYGSVCVFVFASGIDIKYSEWRKLFVAFFFGGNERTNYRITHSDIDTI